MLCQHTRMGNMGRHPSGWAHATCNFSDAFRTLPSQQGGPTYSAD